MYMLICTTALHYIIRLSQQINSVYKTTNSSESSVWERMRPYSSRRTCLTRRRRSFSAVSILTSLLCPSLNTNIGQESLCFGGATICNRFVNLIRVSSPLYHIKVHDFTCYKNSHVHQYQSTVHDKNNTGYMKTAAHLHSLLTEKLVITTACLISM